MTPAALELWIPGRPAAQGSKRHVGGGRLVEQSTAVAPWRERVSWLARAARGPRDPFDRETPLVITTEFVMPRPAATPRHATPPAIRRPDLDKLLRAVFDALTVVAYQDDAQIVGIEAWKWIADPDEPPGCLLTLAPARSAGPPLHPTNRDADSRRLIRPESTEPPSGHGSVSPRGFPDAQIRSQRFHHG